MAYEYTDASTGNRYWVEGRRVYRITTRGSLVYDHDVVDTSPWWQRIITAVRRALGL